MALATVVVDGASFLPRGAVHFDFWQRARPPPSPLFRPVAGTRDGDVESRETLGMRANATPASPSRSNEMPGNGNAK